MDQVLKCGPVVPIIKANGRMEKFMVSGDMCTLTVTSMRVNSKMEKPMDMENSFKKMEACMRVFLLTTNLMEEVKWYALMGLPSKVSSSRES